MIEILKKKDGGYQALTKVLMMEEKVNKHYVEKLNALIKEYTVVKRLNRSVGL